MRNPAKTADSLRRSGPHIWSLSDAKRQLALDNLLSFQGRTSAVITAFVAHGVWAFGGATLRAFGQGQSSSLPVGPAGVLLLV